MPDEDSANRAFLPFEERAASPRWPKLTDNIKIETLAEDASAIGQAIYQRAPLKRFYEAEEVAASKGLQEDVCESLVTIATQIPHRHLGQVFLTLTLASLESHSEPCGSYVSLLGAALRAAWLDPTEDEDDFKYYTNDQWLNLNTFAARLVGAGIDKVSMFTWWQLRGTLEYSDLPKQPQLDTRVIVACEWIVQCAPVLLRDSLLQAEKYKHNTRGDLYDGRPGLVIERWVFWKKRLQQLRDNLGSEAIEAVEEALDRMTAAEQGLAQPKAPKRSGKKKEGPQAVAKSQTTSRNQISKIGNGAQVQTTATEQARAESNVSNVHKIDNEARKISTGSAGLQSQGIDRVDEAPNQKMADEDVMPQSKVATGKKSTSTEMAVSGKQAIKGVEKAPKQTTASTENSKEPKILVGSSKTAKDTKVMSTGKAALENQAGKDEEEAPDQTTATETITGSVVADVSSKMEIGSNAVPADGKQQAGVK